MILSSFVCNFRNGGDNHTIFIYLTQGRQEHTRWDVEIFTIILCRVANMVDGFKYLCYFLKPTSYKIKDSLWLVEKFENRIGR